MTEKQARHYDDWIKSRNLPLRPCGLCGVVTDAMRQAFPELARVRGHVIDMCDDQRYPHWWLVTSEGEIIDPTVDQFDGMVIAYEPWSEGTQEPTGKCHDCGGYVYDGSSFCSDACALATEDYLNNNRHALYFEETR